MKMLKVAIDTEAIGKYIGNELYRISLKKNVVQADIAKRIGVTP